MKKKNKQSFSLDDYVKAMRKGSREAEQELLGPGFHTIHHVHASAKTYNRKRKYKHKPGWEE